TMNAAASAAASVRVSRRWWPALSTSLAELEPERRDLFGDQADQEDHHREDDEGPHRVGPEHLRLDHEKREKQPGVKVVWLIGTKIRSGLKIVMIFSRMRKNFAPSFASLIFDLPDRCSASIGSKHTLYPAFMNAIV